MPRIDWATLLEDENAEDLWNSLFQLVARHPAVRPLRFTTDGASVSSHLEINADLTQELFLELLRKQRFDHYLNTGYSSAEIEGEIVYIELPNLVGARLRKRYPESFRMARRVSSLLKTNRRFKRIQKPTSRASEARRLSQQVYGLREWPADKAVSDPGRFEEALKQVAMRTRDTRLVGRSGSSQLIISNRELERLIVQVFHAIDSPVDVRTIRQLVLSRIPLQDYHIASLDDLSALKDRPGKEARDCRSTPEADLIDAERRRLAAKVADDFLVVLKRAVNDNRRRYDRLIRTIWHVYFDPEAPSQMKIAEMLGVSDSLVSDNRRLIEGHLRKLGLTADDGYVFLERLRSLVAP